MTALERRCAALFLLPLIAAAQSTITTIAGGYSAGFSGDGGPAESATLNQPNGICVDAAGNLYIADLANNRIRKIGTDGVISTVAGNGGPATGDLQIKLGDGGPATSGQVYSPQSVAVDAAGNLYISDASNHVRKVSTDGTISTIGGTTTAAGAGSPFYSGDNGPATSAGLSYGAVAVDRAGNVYLSDGYNQRIRKIAPDGIITTFAGTGQSGFSGDGGPATSARISILVSGMVVDPAGNLFLADTNNHRVRKITPGASSAPTPVTAKALCSAARSATVVPPPARWSGLRWHSRWTAPGTCTSSTSAITGFAKSRRRARSAP